MRASRKRRGIVRGRMTVSNASHRTTAMTSALLRNAKVNTRARFSHHFASEGPAETGHCVLRARPGDSAGVRRPTMKKAGVVRQVLLLLGLVLAGPGRERHLAAQSTTSPF